jgi:hypothetical protein
VAFALAVGLAAFVLAPIGYQQHAAASPRSSFNPSLLRQFKFSDGTALVTHQKVDHANVDTIPNWDGSYDYFKSTFGFSMVGSKPGTGKSTTVVPTEIIPFRFVFSDGTVLDASSDLSGNSTSVQGTINSPIFSPAHFIAGGTDLGTTQFGDAYQRANFWDLISTKAQDYHVLLGAPRVFPAQTVNVPVNLGRAFVDPATNTTVGLVNLTFLDHQTQALLRSLSIDPATLPIFLYHNTLLLSGGFAALGYHNAVPLASDANGHRATLTYVSSTYFDPAGLSIANTTNVDVLNHEVAEWIDDPFVDNPTPIPGRILEVADPAQQFFFDVPLNGMTYRLQDIVFLSWFSRASPSTAVNGWYSFRNNFSLPPLFAAQVQVPLDQQLTFPGADFTVGKGINKAGDIVGQYSSQTGSLFGDSFLLKNGTYTTIDFPDSPGTFATKINDDGEIVGTYIDPDFQHFHGFTYLNGKFTTIDLPGFAGTTDVEGVNNLGDLVGAYIGGDNLWHGFELHNGQQTTIDEPCGPNTAIEGINDHGDMVGACFEQTSDSSTAFSLPSNGSFSTISIPGAPFSTWAYSINNHDQIVGVVGGSSGFAVAGNTRFLWATLINGIYASNGYGNNDVGQTVGGFFAGGIVVTLPNRA